MPVYSYYADTEKTRITHWSRAEVERYVGEAIAMYQRELQEEHAPEVARGLVLEEVKGALDFDEQGDR